MKISELINGKVITRDMTSEEQKAYINETSDDTLICTELDRIEAQLMFTALMTDTLLEVH